MASTATKTATVERAGKIRCAIYTRKSTDEGLDSGFNTLDAQREAAEAYITSQRHENWVVLPTHYGDGGFTGANMDRPGLCALLEDCRRGLIDCVVVYKVDRLTRSLLDFARIIETFDEHGVSFVAVTQQFNTTTSVGRLTLNIVLSFAQFEREMISERTRDKMRAARRKGKWTGGNLVLGYDLQRDGRGLTLNEAEADRVRQIYSMYLDLGSLTAVVKELYRRGWRTKTWTTKKGKVTGGGPFTTNRLYNLLRNIIYTGNIAFEGTLYAGEHPQIVDRNTWNRVQAQLNRNRRTGGREVRNKYGALLKGLLRCSCCGVPMVHTYTRKGPRLYRYYATMKLGFNTCATRSVSAPDIEREVVKQIGGIARNPILVDRVLLNLPAGTPRDHVARALIEFDALWEQMPSRDQERFAKALISAVTYDGRTRQVTVSFASPEIREWAAIGMGIDLEAHIDVGANR